MDTKFLNCGVNPNGMECWKCSKEQEKYCEEQIRTKVCASFDSKKTNHSKPTGNR